MRSFSSVGRLFMVLLMVACLLPQTASAQEVSLHRLDLGSHVTGPDITRRQLKGRFVIVEYWGVNCGPCLAQIPHISELAKEYGHDRLIVVASHSQDATNEEVKEVWEGRAKSEHVAVVNHGHLPGFDVSGIPAAIMFAPNGKEIWRGHPRDIDKPLKDAMKRQGFIKPKKVAPPEPDPIVAGIEAKYFKKQITTINERRRSIDMPVMQLRRALERPSAKQDQIDEATAILAVVEAWIETQKAQILDTKTSDPAAAYTTLESMQTLLGRDTSAQAFADIKAEMEADKPLMDRVRAMRMLREVLVKAKSVGLTEDPAAVKQNKHARTLRAIKRDLDRIIKTWPETDAAKQAQELREQWALDS